MRELAIGQYDTIQSVHRLADLFPGLTTLDITKFGTPDRSRDHSGYTLVRKLFPVISILKRDPALKDDYIDALSRFPLLESIPDLALWEGIDRLVDERGKVAAVTKLSQRCPNLSRLGHWDTKSKRVVDIVLCRRGEGISWEQRPQGRK